MNREYIYRVDRVEKVTDGDTYWLHLDVGFRQTQLTPIRLLGYDCPERRKGSAREKAMGIEATVKAAEWLALGDLWVRTEKDPDDFGRWLGEVWSEDGEFLGAALRAEGLASVWPMRWRLEFDS